MKPRNGQKPYKMQKNYLGKGEKATVIPRETHCYTMDDVG